MSKNKEKEMNSVELERWTAARKVDAVLEVLKGKTTVVDLCREHDLKQSDVENWISKFLKSGKDGLTQRTQNKKDAQEKEIESLKSVVGELHLENRILKKSIELQEREENES